MKPPIHSLAIATLGLAALTGCETDESAASDDSSPAIDTDDPVVDSDEPADAPSDDVPVDDSPVGSPGPTPGASTPTPVDNSPTEPVNDGGQPGPGETPGAGGTTGGGGLDAGEPVVSEDSGAPATPSLCGSGVAPVDPVDLRGAILSARCVDCADYVGQYTADVQDIAGNMPYMENVQITAGATSCTLESNTIPNHDFQDNGTFPNPPGEVAQSLNIVRQPTAAATPTELSQRMYDAVMLNGVVVDLLSAGCYEPTAPRADENGNIGVGCSGDHPWLMDPMAPSSTFQTDSHNAHTQPNGLYHYHGNPMALFDDSPGPDGSPVIGFAADGFPVYGSYFKDDTGTVRKAISGYTLKPGTRPGGADNPGGAYDGMYNADYEFTGAGDLDECNGMTVDGAYGYYVTDTYPHMIKCFRGTPDPSFNKGGR